MKTIKLKLYTDGACSGNPGKGGYAYVLVTEAKTGQKTYNGNGGFRRTTNNRMEILAVIKGLEFILGNYEPKDVDVEVLSDSQLVVNTMTQGWNRNSNTDLWKWLDKVVKPFDAVKFTKVKGHDKDQYNNLADSLAVSASQNLSSELIPDETYEKEEKEKEDYASRKASETEGLFPVEPVGEPTVKEIILKGYDDPSGRSVEVRLSNGTLVSIDPLGENGFMQSRCTKAESAVTVDIAWRFLPYLHGKNI